MFIRMTIINNIKTLLPSINNALEYLKAIEEHFKIANKSLSSTLMKRLTLAQYDSTRWIKDYILYMVDKATKLNILTKNIYKSFLI